MILFLPLLVLKVVVFLLFFLPLLLTWLVIFLPLLLTWLVIRLLVHVVHSLLYKRRKEILDWCLDVKVSPANGFNSNHSDSIRKQIE